MLPSPPLWLPCPPVVPQLSRIIVLRNPHEPVRRLTASSFQFRLTGFSRTACNFSSYFSDRHLFPLGGGLCSRHVHSGAARRCRYRSRRSCTRNGAAA